MERAQAIPQLGVRDDELVDAATAPGPFATVAMTTESATDNASHVNVSRWKHLRRTLSAAGAPDDTLDSIEAVVPDAHFDGEALVVVADGRGVRLLEHGPEPVRAEIARWAALPSLAPLVELRQHAPSYVVVLADRTGADVFGIERWRTIAGEAAAPNDENRPVHKARAGGWSERRYERRVEEEWKANAKAVAEAVAEVAVQIDARLVVVAGDERATALLRHALPSELTERVVEVSGTRAADGSDDEFVHEVERAVNTASAEDTVALLRRRDEERGQADLAADGPDAVVAALAQGRVDVLLVHDDPEDERNAWFGPDPAHVALRREDLTGLGVDGVREGRLVDACIRAALGTGASVRVVPRATVDGGLSALLRWG